MNQRTIFGSQRGKWIILAALVAILVALLAVGVVRAQDAAMMSESDYAENGTDPVVTLTAADPEGQMVYWSLLPAADAGNVDEAAGVVEGDADDAIHFKITPSADGASASLSFKLPPDYEMPRGVVMTETNNTYKVVVVAADDAPGAVVDDQGGDIRNKTYHKLTVVVTDEDEDGSISLSALQPQVGVVLTATLMDDDAADSDEDEGKQIEATWKWEQASAMSGPWTLISGATTDPGATTDLYMPAADVVGMYLRATATYDDRHGDDKTAMAVSANAVRAEPSGTNSAPTFPDGATNVRDVDENSPPGTNVGDPVKASDSPGEILTYTLSGANAGLYSIDRATGQISVGARTMLDHEDAAIHEVMVTATDPGSLSSEEASVATVAITINDVNEAPIVNGGPTKVEGAEGDLDAATEGVQLDVGTYTATDIEIEVDGACTNVNCAWSLEGPDAADFAIGDGTDDTTFGQLSFKNAPDFENPADADMDNVYEVTVKVADNGVANKNKMSATRDVMITVTNAEEPGEITFSSVQPKVGRPFTATLNDPDGMTTGVKWEWMRTSDGGAGTPVDCSNSPTFGTTIDEDSDSYTPKDADLYQCLEAMATYTDPVGSGVVAMGESDIAVVANTDNVAPEFREGGAKPVMQATRSINENTVADTDDDDSSTDATEDNIVNSVMATDPNGEADILTYTLGGPDAAMFRVRQPNEDGLEGGQIEVGTGTKLDYERKKSYMVTVTATDPSQVSATIDITIMVADVNEGPVIAGEDDLTKEFRENSTSTIETFRATDPERRPVYWSLKQDDTDYPDDEAFTINSSGSLSFENPTDFENPSDSAEGGTNTYKVIVVASDDAPGVGTQIVTSERKFTVRVTNVAERGSVTVNPPYPQVGVEVTATLTDGDAIESEISDATWKWSKGSTDRSETSATYTLAEEDIGALRVEATYDAKGDTRKASKSITVRRAPTGVNVPPAFPNPTESRSVDENKANANVGSPITAIDLVDRSRLTYTLSDNDNFSITSTGQLKTKVPLNHETSPTFDIVVTATDPSGAPGTVTINVTVNDINEVPMIVLGPTRALPWPEDRAITELVATYTADDVDEDVLVWSLTGPDASDFNIGNQEDSTPGNLTFKKKPDYETPDASNNVYRVTVEVSDGKLKATRPMTVMVTDVEEDGMVTMSSVQPKDAVPLTASLKDSDGGETGVTWKWAHDDNGRADTPTPNCSTADENAWTTIEGATSDTYTPKGGADGDIGKCLRATASYTDRRGEKTAAGVSDRPVIVDTDNRAPMFETKPQTRKVVENTGKGENIGDGVIEEEGTEADMGDMNPVEAEDPNVGDNLTYTLGGTDMASFGIVRTSGQLQTKAKLDYEARDTYMVTVTATDPSGLSDSVDVTIKVTDENEAPMISTGPSIVGPASRYYDENEMDAVASYKGAALNSPSWSLSGDDAGDFGISSDGMLTFNNTPDYEAPADANTDNVYEVTVVADDGTNSPDLSVTVTVTNVEEMGTVTLMPMSPSVGTEITADLTDPDNVTDGTITWQWSKSMEMDESFTNIDMATSMTYTPVEADEGYYLKATASYTDGHGSGKMAMATTTSPAMVPADQMGMVTLSTQEPMAGMAITATLTDPDMMVTGTTWQWSKSMTMDGTYMDIDMATSMTYTPVEADEGYYLKATASYTDGHGSGKMAMATTTSPAMVPADQMGMVTLSTQEPMAGMAITATLTDPDMMVTGTTWQWSKSMTMDGTYMDIDMATSMTYTPVEADEGYYLKATASYTDGHGSGKMAMATTTSTAMVPADQMGMVTLSTQEPMAGMAITATLTDPDNVTDGTVTWQWSKSMEMDESFTDIDMATSMSYTPVAADEGYYLKATASYTDGEGTGKMAMATTTTTTSTVTAADPLLAKYDTNGDQTIDRGEVIAAILRYFAEEPGVTRTEVIAVIHLYFASE